jgi:glycine oxidase
MLRIGIAGGGIIGCAIGFELADRGATVTVFDARPLAGAATQASAGILAPYIEAHDAGPLFDLTVRGLEEYDPFVARVRALSSVVFEYRRCGTLEVAAAEGRARQLQAQLGAPWAHRAGLRWIEREALAEEAPAVTREAAGALACDAHGFVSVEGFTEALADAAVRRGAEVYPRRVQRIELRRDDVAIHHRGGVQAFDKVVVCAGVWTPGLDPLGETSERIRPVRGQLVRLHAPAVSIARVLWGDGCYIVPWRDGTVLVGATAEDAGFDVRPTADGVRGLLDAAIALVPALASATFVEVRVGLRPATEDGMPILGPASDPRIIYAAGHFRNGVLLAPVTARLVAEM